jgi:hypothetical protein
MVAGQRATAVKPSRELVDKISKARAAGVRFVVSQIADDGEPLGATTNHYYRIPWALAIAGEGERAGAVLSWIERNALTADGDLRPDAREPFVANYASYPLALIAAGAWHLERYDTAEALMDTLRAFQDPATGGAFGERPERRSTGWRELFPTAQLGMTALICGRTDVADGCFRWFADLYQLQPDLPGRLYAVRDDNGLVTDLAAGREFDIVTDLEQPRQAFYNPGIAAAFLARYAMKTGDRKAIELGRDFLRLSAQATDRQYDHSESVQVCKFGWGAALMAEADPAGDHLRWATKMGEWFVDAQLDDGRWHNSPFLAPNPTDADDVEVTAEFIQHLTTILNALGGFERGLTVR